MNDTLVQVLQPTLDFYTKCPAIQLKTPCAPYKRISLVVLQPACLPQLLSISTRQAGLWYVHSELEIRDKLGVKTVN